MKNTQERIIEVTTAMQELLLEKNKRYGDSAINPKKRFSKLGGSEGIKIRLDDKMNRIENSGELRVNDVCDMIGYLHLYLVSEGVTREDILNLID